MDCYSVKPRKTNDGFNLESEQLSHGSLWYRSAEDAVSYAQWNSRTKGARIDIFDTDGNLVKTKELPPGNFSY